MKERILGALTCLGFRLEAVGNSGYIFDNDGIHFYYQCNDDDENFLNIGIIGVYDYNEDKELQYCAVSEKINATMKYVKAYTFINGLGLFYERELLGSDDIETILRHMIHHLEAGLIFARGTIAEIEALLTCGPDSSEKQRQ